MQFPELIITDRSTPKDVISKIASVGGQSFLAEPWTREMLDSMDWCERGSELELAVSTAIFAGEIEECVERDCPCAYYTKDHQGILIAYLASELAGAGEDGSSITWGELEENGFARGLSDILTKEQLAKWDERESKMDTEGFTWIYPIEFANGDFIHIISFGVAPQAQGSGLATKMMSQVLDKSDELNVPIYLECLSERLEGLYGHYGFVTIEERHIKCADIYERIMVRHPKR